MEDATVDFLDEQTSLSNTPESIDVPLPGTGREKWMYASGYLAGYMYGLNKARTAIRTAVEMDKKE